jgi:hypothetical protein
MTRQFEDNPPRRRAEDHNHDCAYESGGLRCGYPGAIGHGVAGGGPMYCRTHIREQGNHIARQAIEWSLKYRPPSYEIDTRNDPTLVALGMAQRDGESDHDHAMRCQGWCMARLKRFRFMPVVDAAAPGADWPLPPPQRMREPGEDLDEALI